MKVLEIIIDTDLGCCRHHYVGMYCPDSVLSATQYRQMAGRAGRAGIDTQGEAILMANNPGLGEQLYKLMQVGPSSGDLHLQCPYMKVYLGCCCPLVKHLQVVQSISSCSTVT